MREAKETWITAKGKAETDAKKGFRKRVGLGCRRKRLRRKKGEGRSSGRKRKKARM